MGVAEGEEDVYTFQYRIHRKLKRYAEALFDDDEIKRIQKEANFGGRSIEIQRKEFQSQILADSMKVVDEKREIEYQHMAALRKKERTSNIAFGVGALVLLLSGGLYSRLQFVRKSKATIEKEKERSDTLLLNILPAEIAEELKEKGRADARGYDLVSILFTDFKGFTELSSTLSATDLVAEINQCFEAFDLIMDKFHIEKIKTIGDAYMAAGGLPIPSKDSVRNTVLAALEMQDFISERKRKMDQQQLPAFEMRVGVHTGPVVAGIVGIKKFQYDIWGDTVNTASRMESNGAVEKVNISDSTYSLIKGDSDFIFEKRGKIEVKGKGEMEMWFVSKSR
jgi:adenylate cyclase